MSLEVEVKFALNDRAELLRGLERLQAHPHGCLEQVDLYLAHPARDFKQTDEALRLRRSGEEFVITYKGPKLDAETKTRREIELPLSGGSSGFAAFRELLEALGFRAVREVCKHRDTWSVNWEQREIHVMLDVVAGLGEFVELEILASSEELETAKQCVHSLARELGLTQSERRGYLDLLMSQGKANR